MSNIGWGLNADVIRQPSSTHTALQPSSQPVSVRKAVNLTSSRTSVELKEGVPMRYE